MDTPYINRKFYRKDYGGVPIDEDAELDALIKRASMVVDEVTNFAVPLAGGLDEVFKRLHGQHKLVFINSFKTAVAAEVEYLFGNGGLSASSYDASSGGSNVRIGNFSYGESNSASASAGLYGGRVSRSVIERLSFCGLLYCGVRHV